MIAKAIGYLGFYFAHESASFCWHHFLQSTNSRPWLMFDLGLWPPEPNVSAFQAWSNA